MKEMICKALIKTASLVTNPVSAVDVPHQAL
jgi:hypothetical protein